MDTKPTNRIDVEEAESFKKHMGLESKESVQNKDNIASEKEHGKDNNIVAKEGGDCQSTKENEKEDSIKLQEGNKPGNIKLNGVPVDRGWAWAILAGRNM